MNTICIPVILLCFSGVYCITSTIGRLDLKGLQQTLNGETIIPEWDTTMDQDILSKNVDGSESTVNVKKAVVNFANKVLTDSSAATEFESIRNLIKTAYQCTLTKYASLTAFLAVQELFELKFMISDAIKLMKKESLNLLDLRDITKNEEFTEILNDISLGKFHSDIDIKHEGNKFQLLSTHNFRIKRSKEIHNVFADMIEKKFGLKIKYKVYTDVMRTKCRNKYDQALVDSINEFICVLNEAIKMFDNFIVDKCVQHGGSFEKNFESLKTGVTGNVMWLITEYDDMKARYSSSVELYRDFSKPGCFVENLEFEISGLKTDLKNKNDPTKIYDHNIHERQSEMNIKIVESTENYPAEVKIGMILFHDEEISSASMPQGTSKYQY